MAIPQDRYIKITSTSTPSTSTERSLQALLITDATADSSVTFNTGTILEFSSATAVEKAFGSTSLPYLWAARYFSYISPSGGTPSKLLIAKASVSNYTTYDSTKSGGYAVGDKVSYTPSGGVLTNYVCKTAIESTPGSFNPEYWEVASPFADNFNRVAQMTSDFGVFTYLTNPMPTADDIKLLTKANAALNYKFLFCSSLTNAMVSTTVAAAMEAIVGTNGTKGTEITYQKKIKVADTGSGATLDKTRNIPKTYITAAIVSAIDWDATDGTVNPMYRQISGESADVVSEATITGDNLSYGADVLDASNVNYYGLVQTYGVQRAFFQRGFNTDGESTLVYVGEMWLKSKITSRLMTMFLNSNKIPANADGSARVFAVIDSVCNQAVKNGVIETGRTFGDDDTTTKLNVLSWSGGDSTALSKIEESGYWLKTWIVESEDGKGYVAKYLLLYAKGDTIIKVEGTNNAL